MGVNKDRPVTYTAPLPGTGNLTGGKPAITPSTEDSPAIAPLKTSYGKNQASQTLGATDQGGNMLDTVLGWLGIGNQGGQGMQTPADAGKTSDAGAVSSVGAKPPIRATYSELAQSMGAREDLAYIELDRGGQNKGLSDYLSQFGERIDNMPGLREQLAQSPAGRDLLAALDKAKTGSLDSEDIIKLQTFLVASGVDIGHPNSASGIDGDYGPKTHKGLQDAFKNLMADPNGVIANLASGSERASQFASERRTAYNDSGDAYVHNSSQTYDPAPAGTDSVPSLPGAGASGADIAAAAERIARSRGTVGKCYRGVKDALLAIKPPVSLEGESAYMAAGQLRSKYGDRFSEVSLNPRDPKALAQLRNLPPGAIVVWGNSGSKPHGHISIALGGGMEASDHVQSQIMNRNGQYSSCTVFIPKS